MVSLTVYLQAGLTWFTYEQVWKSNKYKEIAYVS